MQTSGPPIYRFGPFVVQPDAGTILKNGERIKLQDQPFRLLVVLVENAGHVVTRDQLQKRVWTGNTFVDFDSGLRVAVRKLRDALGDDADTPRYIETIPKRGYRLIVPVIRDRDQPQVPGGSHHHAAVLAEPRPSVGERPRYRFTAALVVTSVAIVAVGGAIMLSQRHRAILSARDTVVLADFANSTGDALFDGALRQALIVALEQSPFLGLVSDEQIHQTLRLMDHTADTGLTRDIALDLCTRIGSDVVVDGSIAMVGPTYVLGLRATSCHSGATLDEEQTQAPRKEDVLHGLDQIAGRFRTRMGESLTTVERHEMPLAEATTPSLEALKAYSLGWKVTYSDGEAASIPFFTRAIELDPKFAMAYAALAVMYGTTGESALAAESSAKAYQLRNRASDRERFFITAYYEGRATGNQERAAETCEAWAQAYPRDTLPHAFLAGFIYPGAGKYEAAVKEARRGVELSPDATFAYQNLASDYLYLNRLDDADAVIRAASQRKIESPLLATTRFDLAFLRGDRAGMDREVAPMETASGADDWLAQHQAFALAHGGQLREATRLLQRASGLAMQGGHRERAALFQVPVALWHALFGNAATARREALAPMAVADNREVEYGITLALAIAGDISQAEKGAQALQDRFPDDTSVKFSYLPTIRGVLSLNRAEPLRALEELEVAAPYELGTPRSNLQGFFGALYPIYVRGLAYLAVGQGTDAAREFQRVLDRRGVVVSDPVGALAQLHLARARALAGDRAKAKSDYERFLTLWREADPALPVLQQARAEAAALR